MTCDSKYDVFPCGIKYVFVACGIKHDVRGMWYQVRLISHQIQLPFNIQLDTIQLALIGGWGVPPGK